MRCRTYVIWLIGLLRLLLILVDAEVFEVSIVELEVIILRLVRHLQAADDVPAMTMAARVLLLGLGWPCLRPGLQRPTGSPHSYLHDVATRTSNTKVMAVEYCWQRKQLCRNAPGLATLTIQPDASRSNAHNVRSLP